MSPINLKEVLKKYQKGWVALQPYTNEVVASGNTLKKVLGISKKKGISNPAVFKPASTKYLYVG